MSPSSPRSITPARAFTLMETLTVVAIITLLISIMLPSLQSAKENARRAECGTRVRQLQIGVDSRATDNAHKLMQSVSQWGGRYGLLIRQRHGFSTYSGLSDEISLQALAGYVGYVNLNNPFIPDRYTDIWWCPSNQSPREIETRTALLSHHWNSFDYTFFGYSYFARVNGFLPFVTKPEQLTHGSLQSDKLLFNDAVYCGGSPVGRDWIYNHGRFGGNIFTRVPIDAMTGTNNAYGDGHVSWKSAAEFDMAGMRVGAWNPALPMLNGAGNFTYW